MKTQLSTHPPHWRHRHTAVIRKATQVNCTLWKLSRDKIIINSEKHCEKIRNAADRWSACLYNSLYFHFSTRIKEVPAGEHVMHTPTHSYSCAEPPSLNSHTHTHTHKPKHSHKSWMQTRIPPHSFTHFSHDTSTGSGRILHETNFVVFMFEPQQEDLVSH